MFGVKALCIGSFLYRRSRPQPSGGYFSGLVNMDFLLRMNSETSSFTRFTVMRVFSAAADVDVGTAENNGKGISRQRSRLVPLGWESFHAPSETSATQVAENEVGVLLVILKSRAPSPSPT